MLILVTFSGGLHLSALQVVAWAGMIAVDTGEHGISVALERTFDGQHPCGLCEFIESSAEDEDSVSREMERNSSLDFKLLPLGEMILARRDGIEVPNAFVSSESILYSFDGDTSVPPPWFA